MPYFYRMKPIQQLSLILLLAGCTPGSGHAQKMTGPERDLIKHSQDLLYAVKTGSETAVLEKQLSALTVDQLVQKLPDDRSRNLFWINLYNAWYQLFAARHNLDRPKIFTHRGIIFSGFSLTLDDIEHGILRHYRSKYSLGYLPQLLPAEVIKRLAVEKPDFRIHFALNCGARSCPPIAFYELDLLDEQLDLAARTYLTSESVINTSEKTVSTTRLMEWFHGDFGGKKGQLQILSKYLGKDLSGYSIRYRDYDWTDDLMNFGTGPKQ